MTKTTIDRDLDYYDERPVKKFSLADLSAVKASETPAKVEFILPDGKRSGVMLHVLGEQSATVQRKVNALMDQRTEELAAAEAQAAKSGGTVPPRPTEDSIAFGHRLVAVRLVGWDGIEDEWSEANALELVRSNADVAELVLKTSKATARFLQLKPTVS